MPAEFAGKHANSAAVVKLAMLAIAYEDAHKLFFPAAAEEMALYASRILLDLGITYWISPDGEGITCVRCRKSSRHPQDVSHRYCGSCHVFHEGAPAH